MPKISKEEIITEVPLWQYESGILHSGKSQSQGLSTLVLGLHQKRLQTQLANLKKEVFTYHFAIGEFDMVIFDPKTASCAIYEIKHSTEVVKAQYRHLIDEEKCRVTEWRFGPITGKYVIYRGESCDVNGIHYLNVEAYLKGLA